MVCYVYSCATRNKAVISGDSSIKENNYKQVSSTLIYWHLVGLLDGICALGGASPSPMYFCTLVDSNYYSCTPPNNHKCSLINIQNLHKHKSMIMITIKICCSFLVKMTTNHQQCLGHFFQTGSHVFQHSPSRSLPIVTACSGSMI